MVKVLYIGNYFDGTGYGNAAVSNILAMDSAGITVVPRAITFNNYKFADHIDKRIKELEDNDLYDIDICIQHTLPSLYSYQAGFENIGIYYSESNNIDTMLWHKYINLLDRSIVCNNQMKKAAILSGVTKPIDIVPLGIDYKKYQNIQITQGIDDLNNSFNFCFVGEFSKRKNILALLKAFHSEFHPSENVNLFLKLNVPGLTSQQTLEMFTEIDTGVINGLKIRDNYKKVIALTGMMPHNDLISVMSQCHVFTCASYGEAWCIPALEAMALGMPVIYPSNTGLEDFCYGWAVDTSEVPCSGAVDAHKELYSCFDTWQEINLKQLMAAMRFAFQAWSYMPDLFNIQQEKAKKQASLFSLELVGRKMKEVLCPQPQI